MDQIFASLGFYPLQMGSPYYAVGSPLFTKATVHLENGKLLTNVLLYDQDGNLVASSDCAQAGVAGETKIIAFEVLDLQSPPPHLTTKLKIKHKGKTVNDQLDIPGKRKGKDK